MIGPFLRAGEWRALVGLSAAAALVGGVAAAVPRAGPLLLPACFALLGAAAAFALDEPAASVVDVTPTGAARRTAIRAAALPVPLAVGVVAGLAVAHRADLPRPATGLALIGTVVLGFSLACVTRRRTGEPGALVSAVVVVLVMAAALVPRLPPWLRTFPSSSGAQAQPSNALWSVTLLVCAGLVIGSMADRGLLRPFRGRP